jgi:uncharacterized phiE125 gp8 family phage protein
MMLAPVRTVAPAAPVVTLDAVKQHLRVDFSDDDTIIQALIDAAVDHLDGWTGILGRALVNQTWRQDFCRFSNCMRLPLTPFGSVVSVTYFDGSNLEKTLDDTIYVVLSDARGPYLTLKPDQSCPGTFGRDDAVRVTFVAGFGADGSTVPAALQTAIIVLVKMNYDASSRDILETVFDALVTPYRRVGV